jgi:hypothetical protein
VVHLSDFAFRVWINALIASDFAGRLDARPERLRSALFPSGTEKRTGQILEAIDELIQTGLAGKYEWRGKPFLQLTRQRACGNAQNAEHPWTDGSFRIEYVNRETAAGETRFVRTSMAFDKSPPSDPITTPSTWGSDQVGKDRIYEDERESNTKTPPTPSKGVPAASPPARELFEAEPSNAQPHDSGLTATTSPANDSKAVSDRRTRQKPAGEDLPGFKRFWDRYPASRRVDPATCQSLWVQTKLEARADHILAVLEGWIRSSQWAEPRFVPSSTTWLKEARYDTPPPSATVQATPNVASTADQERRRLESAEAKARAEADRQRVQLLIASAKPDDRAQAERAAIEKWQGPGKWDLNRPLCQITVAQALEHRA